MTVGDRANDLTEGLLSVMDKKHHPRWPAFTQPGLSRSQLATHFGQEFVTYVRDFPVLIARLLGQGPPDDVRSALAENIYEEQTGGLSGGVAHPELFLRMIDGLHIPRLSVSAARPLPASSAYRAYLDEVSAASPWVVGAAVLTVFVEGSVHERAELAGTRVLVPIDEAIAAHPIVRNYGCPPSAMGLVRAHRAVEGGHRREAWRIVLNHAEGHEAAIVAAVEHARVLWLAYRDGVCDHAGIELQPP